MPNYTRKHCHDFLTMVLGAVYGEKESLLGRSTNDERLRPRSTERAIVARMAVHAEKLVSGTFTSESVADVEYERVGPGTNLKSVWGGRPDARKMSPDLIVHERTNPFANYLAVEVKRATMARRRQWPGGPDVRDLDKLTWMTHLTQLTSSSQQPQRSYQWGAYVELDREGATTWWIEGDSISDPGPNGTTELDVSGPFRWDRPMA